MCKSRWLIWVSHFSLLIPWVCETQICEPSWQSLVKMTNQWTHHITSIRRKKNIHKFPRHFDILFRISMGKKSTSFRRTFFDVISTSEISMSFWCTFFDLISMDEKSTLFRGIFCCNLDGKLISRARIFWCDFKGQKIVVVLISLFEKFLVY